MRFDVIIIGGGLAGMAAGCVLQKKGLRTVAVTFGVSLHDTDYKQYRKLGGLIMMGDRVTSGLIEGDTVKEVYTSNLGEMPLQANRFILSTGKFLSGGLSADMEKVTETIFGLDINADNDRAAWCDADFFKKQAFLSFGVKIDKNHNPFKGGMKIKNLYVLGELVEGRDITSENAIKDIIAEAEEVADKF